MKKTIKTQHNLKILNFVLTICLSMGVCGVTTRGTKIMDFVIDSCPNCRRVFYDKIIQNVHFYKERPACLYSDNVPVTDLKSFTLRNVYSSVFDQIPLDCGTEPDQTPITQYLLKDDDDFYESVSTYEPSETGASTILETVVSSAKTSGSSKRAPSSASSSFSSFLSDVSQPTSVSTVRSVTPRQRAAADRCVNNRSNVLNRPKKTPNPQMIS